MLKANNPTYIVDSTVVDIDDCTLAQLSVFGGKMGLTAEEYASHLVSLQIKLILNEALKKSVKKIH